MASGQIFELAVLLSLKDMLSGGLGRVEAKLREGGKACKGMLQDFESLRRGLQRDLAMGGVGVGILTMLGKGVGVAGNFESAITDLRLSIETLGKDGHVNMGVLNDQMARFESLGMRLGNQLPGTTEDFVQMFAVMKQGGIDTEAILGGAGEAVANLAVVLKDIPRDLAEPFAQYGKQFNLKPEEYAKSADLFARIFRASGLRAQELIEGSKFFQLRAGAPLGLKGLEGAETGARLMAVLRSRGLEGGIAGRESSMFFEQLATSGKELKALKKEFGIDLQIFGKKGDFLGIDNVFKQMEKLRGLSAQTQMEVFKRIGGQSGAAVGNIFMQMGESGWKEYIDYVNTMVPLTKQANEVMANFNAKLEAVKGTLSNLVATSFAPMLDTLKPLLDTANTIVGFVQGLMKTHPAIAGVASKILGMTGVVLGLQAGFGVLIKTIQLWRITSALAAGDSALVTSLARTQTQAVATTSAINTNTQSAGKLSRGYAAIPSGIKTTVALVGIGLAIDQLMQLQTEVWRRKDELEQLKTTAGQTFMALKGVLLEGGGVPSSEAYNSFLQKQAGEIAGIYNVNQDLKRSLDNREWGSTWENMKYPTKPYTGAYAPGLLGSLYDEKYAGQKFQERDRRLLEPDIMKEFVRELRSGRVLPDISREGRGRVEETLKQSDYFGQSYQKAAAALSEEALKLNGITSAQFQGMSLYDKMLATMTPLTVSTQLTSEAFTKVPPSVVPLLRYFDLAATAAADFANRVGGLNITTPSFSSTGGTPSTLSPGGPARRIQSLLNLTSRNDLGERAGSLMSAVRPHGPITINVNAPGASAGDADHIAQTVRRELEQVMTPDFLARSVLYSARRDQERS